VLLAARLLRPARMSLQLWTVIGIVALLASIQSYIALWHNQPTITVGFLILLAFTCLDAGRPLSAGAALALAAAIKLTPAAFVLIFLIDRQYRALAAFAVIGGGLGLLSLAVAGIDLHLTFVESLHAIRGAALLNAVNVSLLPALLAAGTALGLRPAIDIESPLVILRDVPAWLPAALSLAGVAVVAAFLQALRTQPAQLRRGIGVFALSLILALFGPLGWLHYYMLPLFMMPGLFGLLGRRAAILLALAVAITAFRYNFMEIGRLPWPVADYVWASVSTWLAVLAALYLRARQAG